MIIVQISILTSTIDTKGPLLNLLSVQSLRNSVGVVDDGLPVIFLVISPFSAIIMEQFTEFLNSQRPLVASIVIVKMPQSLGITHLFNVPAGLMSLSCRHLFFRNETESSHQQYPVQGITFGGFHSIP